MQALGPGRQACMQACFAGVCWQAPELRPYHPPASVHHQASGSGLQQGLHPGTQACSFQMAVKHRATLAFAYRAMAPWCRGLCTAMGRHQLIARVIQKITIGRVRGLPSRRHAVGIARPVAFKPVEVADAVSAKFFQGGIADHPLGFVLEIIKHRLWVVIETGGLLLRRTTTGVHHATAFGTGATAGKTVGHDHMGACAAGLQRRAGTRRAPADHQYITGIVPVAAAQAIGLQGCEDLAVTAGVFATAHDSTRALAPVVADTALAIWLAAI